MKTFHVVGHQRLGTQNRASYSIVVYYREAVVISFHGESAFEHAMRYVAEHGGRATIEMGERA